MLYEVITAKGQQRAGQITDGVGGVDPAGLRIAPAQVVAHCRQDQGIGKAGEAGAHRRAERKPDGDEQSYNFV